MVYWVTELIEVVVTWSRKSAIFIIVADLGGTIDYLSTEELQIFLLK